MSQALHHAEDPARAIAAVHRILRPGGQILILDLLKHSFQKAGELYGDRWPGFAECDLHRWLESAGFRLLVKQQDRIPVLQLARKVSFFKVVAPIAGYFRLKYVLAQRAFLFAKDLAQI